MRLIGFGILRIQPITDPAQMIKGKNAKTKPPTASSAERDESERQFQKVVSAFEGDSAVTVGANKGFGAGALKVDEKIFAMISSKGEFIVKLSKAECSQIVEKGEGRLFDPGHGRLMKEWVIIESGTKTWRKYALAARQFVSYSK